MRLKSDLVAMGWHMPELDGVEAKRAIHARKPGVDVMAFSSADDDVIADAFRDAGASAYGPTSDVHWLLEELQR